MKLWDFQVSALFSKAANKIDGTNRTGNIKWNNTNLHIKS